MPVFAKRKWPNRVESWLRACVDGAALVDDEVERGDEARAVGAGFAMDHRRICSPSKKALADEDRLAVRRAARADDELGELEPEPVANHPSGAARSRARGRRAG